MASYDDNRVTYFAETDFRNRKTRFGIKAKDRTRHVYVIGKTGMGKSTLLENMAVQDIQNGEGMAFMDPHGSTADKLLDYVPEHRKKDVVYFAPFDTDNPISFNVMEDVGPDKRHLVVSGLMSAFKKIWVDAWSARMEYILNNVLLALLEFPGATLLGVNRMLSDKDFRKAVVDNISDPSVKAFWVDEFAKYGDRYMQEAGASIQNKIGQFTSNPLVRNIIGQAHSSFDLRKVMDDKKILIINLSKGQVGEQNSNLLGGMLITKIYLAAMSRADRDSASMSTLPNFYFYVDEFQSFANESFADILSEARKYKLNLTIAHQYIEQMVEEVRNAVFGNVGTTITFRVGPFDAEVLEKVFAPTFAAQDIVNLGFAQIYLTMMIDGIGSKPFSATTLGPIPPNEVSYRAAIIEHSRSSYARPKAIVEKEIRDWIDTSFAAPKYPSDQSSARPAQPQDAPRRDGQFIRRERTAFPAAASAAPRPPRQLPPQPSAPEPAAAARAFVSRPDQASAAPARPIREQGASAPARVVPIRRDASPSPAAASEKESLSLVSLKKKEDAKAASTEKMAGLKEALRQALGDAAPSSSAAAPAKPVREEAPKAPERPSGDHPHADSAPKAKAEPDASAAGAAEEHAHHVVRRKPREIPEDVLRRILD